MIIIIIIIIIVIIIIIIIIITIIIIMQQRFPFKEDGDLNHWPFVWQLRRLMFVYLESWRKYVDALPVNRLNREERRPTKRNEPIKGRKFFLQRHFIGHSQRPHAAVPSTYAPGTLRVLSKNRAAYIPSGAYFELLWNTCPERFDSNVWKTR